MSTPEEIEAIRAERAAKRAAPHLTALYEGVEYPEGTEVWTTAWTATPPRVIGRIVSVNPDNRAEVAVAQDGNHRRWSNVPREMRVTLGNSEYPTRAQAFARYRNTLLRERVALVDEIARVDAALAAIAEESKS